MPILRADDKSVGRATSPSVFNLNGWVDTPSYLRFGLLAATSFFLFAVTCAAISGSPAAIFCEYFSAMRVCSFCLISSKTSLISGGVSIPPAP